MNPKVTIIVPCYNVEIYIKSISKSILEQTYKDFEAIFINDGSTDHTLNELQFLKKFDKRIRVFDIPNGGVGNARNFGLEKSTGEYIYFCDPDDNLENDLLEKIINNIKDKEVDIAIFGYQEKNTKKNRLKKILLDDNIDCFDEKDIKNFFKIADVSRIIEPVWNKVYKKNFLLNNKLLFTDDKKGQDYIFNLKVLRYVKRLSYVNSSLYTYLVGRYQSAQTVLDKNDFSYQKKIIKERQITYDYLGIDSRNIESLTILQTCYYDTIKIMRSCNSFTDYKKYKLSINSLESFKYLKKVDKKYLNKKDRYKLIFLENLLINYCYQSIRKVLKV